MSSKTTLVSFKNLKGFPHLSKNQIEILPFVEASNEIIEVIESFGKLFSPVVSDMKGNVKKIIKIHEREPEKFYCIEHLLDKNLNLDPKLIEHAADALLWLKRALHLIWIFFSNILNDSNLSENLRHHLQDAYDKTLKPYHGYIVQASISLIYRWVPKRSDLIGKGTYHDENIEVLAQFLPTMELHLTKIDVLLKENNFHS